MMNISTCSEHQLQYTSGPRRLPATTVSAPSTASSYFPLADANGNYVSFIDNAGNVQDHYVYDAFGNTVSQTGAMADDFRFRFSSKYLDDETGLYNYGVRYYAPAPGRWLSRDPIEEQGGTMLYGFVRNDAVGRWDLLGMGFWNCKDECSTADLMEIRTAVQARIGDNSPKAKEAGFNILESLNSSGNVSTMGDLLQCIGANPAAAAQTIALSIITKKVGVNIDPSEKLNQLNKFLDSKLAAIGGSAIWIYIKFRRCKKEKMCWKPGCTYLDYGKKEEMWHRCSWDTIDGMPPGDFNDNGNFIMTGEQVKKLMPRCTMEAINAIK